MSGLELADAAIPSASYIFAAEAHPYGAVDILVVAFLIHELILIVRALAPRTSCWAS